MSDQTPYYAKPRQPRLIWNDRDKRKVAEPLPSQTVEVISPFYAEKQTALDMSVSSLPENRLIWTNDNLVALTSLLHGDGTPSPKGCRRFVDYFTRRKVNCTGKLNSRGPAVNFHSNV